VPLGSGAALVIGANLGTTSTAALAVIGATPNAKRVAAGHVAFNVITGTVALALLPLLLLAIRWSHALLRLEAEPAAVLAAFHTIFNLLGVALLWPLTGRLLGFLETRFRTAEEDEAAPRYLDRNVLVTPRLAFDAMVLELTRVGQISRRLARAALSVNELVATLDWLSNVRRLAEQIERGTRFLASLTLPRGEDAHRDEGAASSRPPVSTVPRKQTHLPGDQGGRG
jgi:phosphate:Na+ symporter